MARKRDWVMGGVIGGSIIFSLLLLYVVFSGFFREEIATGGKRIALIEIKGTILDPRPVVKQLKRYTKDDAIPAIVVRIESPGGGIAASQEIYGEIQQTRAAGKKVVASMGSVAASGGYYVAVATDTIVANPGTITGSIGVIAEIPNTGELWKKVGLEFQVIKSGTYKDMGSPVRKMTDQERALFQGVIDDAYEQFVDAIVAERGLTREAVLQYADGRIFTGRQALTYGFVDVLGGYDDAVDLAAAMVGMKPDPPTTQERKRTLGIWSLLFGAFDRSALLQHVASPTIQYVLR